MTLENLLSQVGMGTKQLTDRFARHAHSILNSKVGYSRYNLSYNMSSQPDVSRQIAVENGPQHASSRCNLSADIRLGRHVVRQIVSYSEVPVHDHHVYYAYEPSASLHGPATTSKHNYGGGHKSSASMSALTLLAFLFFLHILQQCIKDHMTDMSAPPVMIMTAGREGDETVSKSANFNKIDKTGKTQIGLKDITENNRMDAIKQNKITEKYDVKNPYDSEASSKLLLMKTKIAHDSTKPNETKQKYLIKNYGNRSSNFDGFVSAIAMNEE